MRRLTLRLVPVAGAAWAVALTAVLLPDAAPGIAAALWSIVAVMLAVSVLQTQSKRRARIGGHVVVITIFALACAAAAASHVALAQPAREAVAELSIGGGRAITVHAVIAGKVERRGGGTVAFDAVADLVRVGSVAHSVDAPVVIDLDPGEVDEPRDLDVGAVIEARGIARPAYAGDRAVLIVTASRGVTVVRAPIGVLAATAALRQGLVASVDGLPDPGAGLIPGLSVGDTSAVSERLDAQMKESSLSHLTAVSGANCALVVALAYALVALMGGRRLTRVVCAGVALGGFVVLVTPEPSVVRAATMAGIAMLGVLLGRTGAGMAMLSLAIAMLMVLDPWLATSLGFALSATATASLLLFARPLADGLARHLPRSLALALAVPLAAQLACGPLLVLITPAVPIYGVLANLLAAPAAPAGTLIGLAACLAAPVPVLQDGLAALAWLPAAWIAATAATITTIPGDVLPWFEGWPGAVALGVVGLAVGVIIAVRADGPLRDRLVRGAAILVVALTAGVGGGVAALGSVAGRWTLPSTWSVLACDVGQGDAVLLRSEGAVMLVDTGPSPERLKACLDRVGTGRIDLLVLTHFDLDHVGGVSALQGRVGTVLHGPAYGPAPGILADLGRGGARLLEAHRGLDGTLGAAHWRVLWPVAESRAFPSGNDASVVLDVRGGGVPPTLLLGDLSAAPQRAIAASGSLDPPYAIVKVAHHGSADQDAGLYRLIEPSIAMVTVGADNDYGHPRDETLDTLADVDARVLRTDLEGIVAISRVADGWELWRERRSDVGAGG